MFNRILVPLDGSRFSSVALNYAEEIATHFYSEIILMQVVEPTSLAPIPQASGVEGPGATSLLVQQSRMGESGALADATKYLQGRVQKLEAAGIHASMIVEVGVPAISILRFCHRQDIDLIVMRSHGRGGIKRAILGSVADKVLRQSKVPVMVIR